MLSSFRSRFSIALCFTQQSYCKLCSIILAGLLASCFNPFSNGSGSDSDDVSRQDTPYFSDGKLISPSLSNDYGGVVPWPEIVITGNTGPGFFVTVTGGATVVTQQADPDAGYFCIQVTLLWDQLNSLEVVARDQAGNESEPATFEITHQSDFGGEKYQETTMGPFNVAVDLNGDNIQSDNEPEEGELKNLINGVITDPVEINYSDDDFLAFGKDFYVIQVKLNKEHPSVNEVVVHFTAPEDNTDSFAQKYSIWGSNRPDVEIFDDKDDTPTWNLIFEETGGDGGVISHPFTAANYQHIALILEEDDEISFSETFHLSEIQVMSVPEIIPAAVPKPVCDL
jgi:hypothetical protein